MQKTEEIVENLITLQNNYIKTYRGMISEEKFEGLVKSKILKDYDYDNKLIRESLIEHVGHLPIVASYLHQYVEHKDEIDLGRVLIMLGIHDIGETEVGDVFTYKKNGDHEEEEREAAKKLLPEYLFEYFDEFEHLSSTDAKFARACDYLTPMLHELNLPSKIILKRFKHFGFTTENIIAKKKSLFEWDSVLSEVFDYVISQYPVEETNGK